MISIKIMIPIKVYFLCVRVGTHPIPRASEIFLKVTSPKSTVVWQSSQQLVNSSFGKSNLVPFHFWWREFVLKSGKLHKYFLQDYLKHLLLLLVKQSKTFSIIIP